MKNLLELAFLLFAIWMLGRFLAALLVPESSGDSSYFSASRDAGAINGKREDVPARGPSRNSQVPQ